MRKVLTLIMCIAIWSSSLAQSKRRGTGAYYGEILKLSDAMKHSRDLSYRYSFTAAFPNGQTDSIGGENYVFNQGHILYNDNSAFTLAFSDHWFYRANHRDKTVSILNTDKHLTKGFKEALTHDVFENGSLAVYLDSIINRYASVKNLRRDGDTIHIELSFPEKLPIQSVYAVYDDRTSTIINYEVQTYQPYRGGDLGANKGTLKVMKCWDFARLEDNKAFAMNTLFTVSNDKVRLKKYKKYKLITKL